MSQRVDKSCLARFLNSTAEERKALTVRIGCHGLLVKERRASYRLTYTDQSLRSLQEIADVARHNPRLSAKLQLFYEAESPTDVESAVFAFRGRPMIGGAYPHLISMKTGESLEFEHSIRVREFL
jgi:hypothetical protein